MYRHSPVRNQRSKGIRIKHVVQVCLLIAVCFWLIFQVKRSHDKKKEFDANNPKISLNTRADEIVKFGRKDLQPKLEETTTLHEDTQEQEDEDEQEENKHDEEEQDDDKIEEEKDDGGGGEDDKIDENEQEKSNMEIDRDEVDIIDEDKETEESEEKESEEKDGQSQTENSVDHDEDGSIEHTNEDGSTEHTNEAREEHYKADDASSAVITHDPGNEIKNQTLDDNSSENVGLVDNTENENGSIIQEKDSESMNATSAVDFHENGPPQNTTTTSTGYQFDSNATVTEITQGFSKLTDNSEMLKSNESTGEEDGSDESKSEILETNNEDSSDPTHVEEKEVRNDLETLPDIETEGGNSEDTAAE